MTGEMHHPCTPTSCGARTAFGCSRWTTAGAGYSPPSSIGTPSASAGMCASEATASPPFSRSPWGLRGCMPRPPPVRRGGWPCGSRLPVSKDHLSPTRSSSGSIQPSYAFVEQPQTNGVAERFNRTLKLEQIIHGRILYRNMRSCGTPSAGSSNSTMPSGSPREERLPERRSSSSWRGTPRWSCSGPPHETNLCPRNRSCDTAAVALFGYRHNRGVDDLAAHRQIALILQVAIERLE